METEVPVEYHLNDGPRFWSPDRVLTELGVSRPTAYKLMHASGACTKAMRHIRVFAPEFITYINSITDEEKRDV